MINITNKKARRRYQQEFERHSIRLERTFAREIRPVLGRQFFNAAALVRQGVLDAVDHAVDLERERLHRIFKKHYKRVTASFGRKAFRIFEEVQAKSIYPESPSSDIIIDPESPDYPLPIDVIIEPQEFKTPKDEYWRSMDRWAATQAAEKVRRIQKTTKKVIANVIRKGMGEGESHREIAKRIRKTSAVINPHRSITISLTETHTAAVKSVDTAVASTRIEMQREWLSSKDSRTRTRDVRGGFEH
ncbi:hypothetical protein LCGC14_1703020, partial [marine sediment metagenome]